MAEKKEEYKPPGGWINGKLAGTKEVVDYFYEDDICAMIDDSVKPSQIRSSIFNELNADRNMEKRIVQWDIKTKKAISIKLKAKKHD